MSLWLQAAKLSDKMRTAFRVDASSEIGSGHLMRCLILADALCPTAKILFVCRSISPALEELLVDRDFSVKKLPAHADAEIGNLGHSSWLGVSQEQDVSDSIDALSKFRACAWLIVDHYALDFRYESAMRRYARNILVVDDLADRKHDCDILVDQNTRQSPD